ncbi:TlpA disulfide reductase family protein [Bacteroides sp.]|uniref:TlpA disulfide reductase family protein n=1 Tax=Bacteroides sp. TaxID=29523 RepID=UPI002628CEA2|nr:TlpA disulfide reductase family protein [Bacteroides sp.]
MKKLIYLLAVTAVFAACNSGNKGYTITGTVDGSANGDTVFLETVEGRQFVKLDTAVIENGTFTFKGTQDSAVNRYITYKPAGKEGIAIDFFLENGNINIKMSQDEKSATGTTNNDIFQGIRVQMDGVNKQMMTIYESMSDTTLTDEQRQAKGQEMDALDNKLIEIAKAEIGKNITNPVGILLLKQNYYYLDVADLDPLMPQIPAAYNNDEVITKIKNNVENMKATAVGQKFTDFEMLTPEGKAVKLSDYAGKGKVVLVDFWASWCGPCRREMPNLVEAYAKYKNKNFEIVGVSLDRDGEAWKEGIKKLNITWPQMSDLKYWDNQAAKMYAVSSIPHTMLIDGEGTIIARGLHGDQLEAKLAEVVK